MDFSKIPVIQALTHKMGWLSQRQEVLARNIANANTPDYAPRDLEQPNFGAMVRGAGPGRAAGPGAGPSTGNSGTMPLLVTHTSHLGAVQTGSSMGSKEYVVRDSGAPKRPGGNSVVLEKELMKVSKTAMEYEVSTNIYRKYVAMFRTALGRTGS